MGTRHIIMVQMDNEYKVMQYGQWDGYLDGQGQDVLRFLRNNDLAAFSDKVAQCREITEEEINEVNATDNWPSVYPHLSRDCSSDILDMIMESPLTLYLDKEFPYDSLFCEYAYVIDLDKNVFEVYKGWNKEKTPEDSRFYKEEPDHMGHYPVKFWFSYPLHELPTDEEFLANEKSEEDEE